MLCTLRKSHLCHHHGVPELIVTVHITGPDPALTPRYSEKLSGRSTGETSNDTLDIADACKPPRRTRFVVNTCENLVLNQELRQRARQATNRRCFPGATPAKQTG